MMILNKRCWVKAITWRIFGTAITVVVTIFITGNVEIGLVVGPIDFVIKVVLYYIHEKFWLLSKFGIKAASEIDDKS